jgi:hypothetical protein
MPTDTFEAVLLSGVLKYYAFMIVTVSAVHYIQRVILILCPSWRIVRDIFPDAVQFILMADDVLVIIPLSQCHA